MIEIRETRREDIPDIMRLWADPDVMQFVGFPQGLHRSIEEMEDWYQRLADSRPQKNHYVVFDDGVFCGETFYSIDEEGECRADLDIKLFAFARGRGLAKRALAHAIDQACCHGAQVVYVTPNARNDKALALYVGLGFQEKEAPEGLLSEEDKGTYLYMERSVQG